MSANVEIGVLGPLDVRRAGSALTIRRGVPRVLLCSLVLHRGTTVAADTLIDHIWGDDVPVHPANALQTQMAYLRRALGGAAVAPIVTTSGGYLLDLSAGQIDIGRFEAHRLEARRRRDIGDRQSLTAALAAYRRALDLWRGQAFFDVAGLDFANIEIVRLEELELLSHEEMAETLLALGQAPEAAASLQGLVAAHPLRERLQELLIVALYRTGRQSEALRSYTRARETLAEELGVEPGPGLRELERQVLLQDVELDWRPPPGFGPEVSRRNGSADDDPGPQPPTDAIREEADGPPPGPLAGFDLIGRDRELARVGELLSQCRLLTLTGPGGAGKTRLALELAARQTIGRTTVIDLAAATDADVWATLLAGLDVGAGVETDPVGAIAATLGDDRCLLVLDTCERVVGGLAPIVESMLAVMANVTVLATSRRPLGIPGEIAWPVPPLTVPTEGAAPESAPAFELFVRRAKRVKPDLVFTEEDVAIIAALCRALDGLPLAIELAAAHMDVLTPTAIHEHLAGASTLAIASGPERQRTLQATADWSVGLLDDDERDLLHRLAVFAPTFDLDAVLAVSGCDPSLAIERFVALVRSSLVAHDEGDRYRLLDTVRFYLLATDDQPQRLLEARRRHAEHYAALAATAFNDVRTPSQGPWMDRLRADLANLRVALDWCFDPDGDDQLGARLAGDIAWIWTLQGNLVDSGRALERAGSVDAPPLVRARVLHGIGLIAAPLGDSERVREVCSESAEIGRRLNDEQTVAAALLTLGVAEWASGDLATAAATHEEAVALFDGLDERWGATICRILRARTARDMGELDVTEALLERAVDDAKAVGDRHVIGIGYEQYARLCIARGDWERAEVWANACFEQNEALGYTEGICAALAVLGQIRLAEGDAATARATQLRVLGLASAIGHLGATCGALEAIAEIDASTGEHRQAALLLLHAERARRQLPLSPPEAERMADLRRYLRAELGAIWDDIAVVSRLGSLPSLVSSLLETG